MRGLNKTFGPQHVLRGIDLDIERGQTNIIIGGSGQGKSVLMKHLMGLLKPDAGQIWVDGEDVVPLDDVELGQLRRKFGMVFQYAALFDSMNVVENIAFPLHRALQPVARRDHGAGARSAATSRPRPTCAASSRSSRPSCRAGSASASAWRGR